MLTGKPVAYLLCPYFGKGDFFGGYTMTNLPEGSFKAEITLSGGTGRTTVQSPADVRIENGVITAEIVWSSSNYDLMIVDGKSYTPTSIEGGSRFTVEIPSLDTPLGIQAETVAMAAPHMIDYTLTVSGKEILSGESSETVSKDVSEMTSEELSSLVESLHSMVNAPASDTGTTSGTLVFSATVNGADQAHATTSLPPFLIMIFGAVAGAAIAFVAVSIGKKKKK